jgi:hypothetical protein
VCCVLLQVAVTQHGAAIARRLEDQDVAVRAAAVHALSTLSAEARASQLPLLLLHELNEIDHQMRALSTAHTVHALSFNHHEHAATSSHALIMAMWTAVCVLHRCTGSLYA